MSNKSIEPKAHAFELAGMGRGPYSFIGIYEMPNLSENSAANFGNSNPYAGAPKLKGGLGTCCNCGMAISVICIIKDADGELYGVGSDCAEKTGDASLGNDIKIAVAKRRAHKRRLSAEAKQVAQRATWLAKVCNDQGETNQQRLGREQAEKDAQEAAQAARRAKVAEILLPFAERMEDGQRGFRDSIASDLRRGMVPYGRGLSIALEILAKQLGRSGSKAYGEEFNRCDAAFEAAKNIQ